MKTILMWVNQHTLTLSQTGSENVWSSFGHLQTCTKNPCGTWKGFNEISFQSLKRPTYPILTLVWGQPGAEVVHSLLTLHSHPSPMLQRRDIPVTHTPILPCPSPCDVSPSRHQTRRHLKHSCLASLLWSGPTPLQPSVSLRDTLLTPFKFYKDNYF